MSDTLRGCMLHADDVGVITQSPGQLSKIMSLILIVCATLDLAISETEMCLGANGMPEATVIYSVEAATQVNNQTTDIVYLGGNDVNWRIRIVWSYFGKYTLEMYDPSSAALLLLLLLIRAL